MEQATNGKTYIQEIEAALEVDEYRLGEVFREKQKDPKKQAKVIAKDMGLGTSGTVYTNLRAIELLTEGYVRKNIKPISANQMAGMLKGFAKRHRDLLSEKTQDRLAGMADELDKLARDEEAITQENDEIERDSKAERENVPGVYVYTYPHYMRHPIREADEVELNPRTYLKVGVSKTGMDDRVKNQAKTYMPEPPLILRRYRVPDGDLNAAEKRLHNHLQTAGHGRLWTRGANMGKEWFLTQLDFLDSTSDLMGLELYQAYDVDF